MQLRALAVDLAGIAWARHIEQQVVGIVIPAHILHLTIMVLRNVAQINGIERLFVLIVDDYNEFIVVAACRTAIEGEPSDVDTLGDKHFEVFSFVNTRQVFVLLFLAQTIDGSIGLVLQRNHVSGPTGTIILH